MTDEEKRAAMERHHAEQWRRAVVCSVCHAVGHDAQQQTELCAEAIRVRQQYIPTPEELTANALGAQNALPSSPAHGPQRPGGWRLRLRRFLRWRLDWP